MASDEAPRTANAEMMQGKADDEKLVSERSVMRELKTFATYSRRSFTWKLKPNAIEPDEEELDTNPFELEEQSSLKFANSDLCNFNVRIRTSYNFQIFLKFEV